MSTEQEREEIIRQLLKLFDEMAEDDYATRLLHAKLAIARRLVRKLAEPTKPDGDVGDGQR